MDGDIMVLIDGWKELFILFKATFLRNPAAQYEMSNRYRHSNYPNPKKADKLLRKAAKHGHAQAQYELGRFYSHSEEEMVRWCHKAAEQGHAEAQHDLRECYAKGIGVDRNPKEARKWGCWG